MTRIIVFGSNLHGIHGAGQARDAYERYGAEWGIGAGRTGECYAIPTKISPSERMPLVSIAGYVAVFLDYARAHADLTFEVWRLGCGRAGYTDVQIAPMFKGAPSNCELPRGWRELSKA